LDETKRGRELMGIYDPCEMCGEVDDDLVDVRGRMICESCRDKLADPIDAHNYDWGRHHRGESSESQEDPPFSGRLHDHYWEESG
jgi:hypothetical protein